MPRLQQPKRVLVVGAGAAGMSCADALANHPDQFEVTLIDAQAYCGGQAFSIPIDKNKYGSEWMNQGVQGGSYIYQSVPSKSDGPVGLPPCSRSDTPSTIFRS